jgi:chemotaxis signal transduction protein
VTIQTHQHPDATRPLRILHIGSVNLGVFEDQVLTITEFSTPAPLPFSPDSVLGIVSIEGRMVTVLDAAASLGSETSSKRKLIVTFRGDEQLALVADEAEPPVEIRLEQIAKNGSESKLLKGTIRQGERDIQLLDVSKLFSGIIQGRERRRRRFQ